jgi:hypothetical protein
MGLTRKELIAGAAATALGAAGVYELVDRFSGSGPERASATTLPPEQHVLAGVEVVTDNGVEVVVPPLHHEVVTARLKVEPTRKALQDAQAELEHRLAGLERRFEPTPAGLGVTVAWGLPYFRRYVPDLADAHVPVDRRASQTKRHEVRALVDAVRFPSDPHGTVLEANDVAVLLRSDRLDHIEAGSKAIFDPLKEVLEVTSIRKGFVGGGFDGGKGLPKEMALAAGIDAAELIPDGAELFLGFTSSQRAGLGPRLIANLETLGYTDPGYFRQGTHMHLSHLTEDLANWYLNFDHSERVQTAFEPGKQVPEGTQTVPQPASEVSNTHQVKRAYRRSGTMGHSASIQTTSRLDRDVIGPDGTVYPKGTAVPHRADFNTLDNPFFWSADPLRDKQLAQPTAGVHFVVFNPTSDDFHRNRLAMDGVLPDGTKLPFARGDRGQGFNAVLQTTHRQNFLVPPRRHRSFPLVELLA